MHQWQWKKWKNPFLPLCFSSAPPSQLNCFFFPQVVSPKWGTSKTDGILPMVPYIPDVTFSLTSWPWTVLPGRNETTFLKGPLNICLIQAVFWDSTHPYVVFHATRSRFYWVKKKKPIITKTTTESNFLLSLWIKSRFPSDKTSPREPSPVTQVHLGLAEPTASSWVPPGRHCPSRIHRCSEDIRGSSDRKTSLLLGNPIKCAGSSVGWRGTLKLFSSFLGHAAAVPRRRWGHC